MILGAASLPRLLVAAPLQQPRLDELAKPGGGNRLGKAASTDEFLEPVDPVEGLSDQQHRRATTYHVERSCERATLRDPVVAIGERSGKRD